ncbi:hypothetical protein ZIOFF_058172 [Zingiber officinale]|uniref:Phytocyanin domain-containing protein n=2 Tax=Zingiber officinale TaxID=94328 RepID=A0A8J5F7X9_ZINOF|nr:hypothetical protein ZIOFF_058172 [Zingiber officinale]
MNSTVAAVARPNRNPTSGFPSSFQRLLSSSPLAINFRRRRHRRPQLNSTCSFHFSHTLSADCELSSMASSLILSIALLLAITSSEAKEFLVGGADNAWQIPPNTTDSLNQWAEKNRFQVGDSLVWKYDPAKDSVLEVTREAYLSCDRSRPLAEHKEGASTVELRRSGAYYFISGAAGACEEGQRLIVVVMSDRHSLRARLASPAMAPSEYEGPAVAPTSGAGKRGGAIAAAAAAMVALSGSVFML